MRVVIVGAGKLGYSVARMLQRDHEVYVIEQQAERASVVEETLDVQVFADEWSNPEVLRQIDLSKVDLVVATTEVDEVNIVICLMAKAAGHARTIARVRNPQYVDGHLFGGDPKVLGIDLLLSPERVTSEEIAKLVNNPEALSVQHFADGRLQMLELLVPSDAPAVNMPLRQVDFGSALVGAIQRKGQVLIPRGEDVITAGDRAFVLARTGESAPAEALLGQQIQPIKRVTILGGGRIGKHLAMLLNPMGISLTIVDSNLNRCRQLAGLLPKANVLHGDGADAELLRDESVTDTDMFVATTSDDKLNLLACLVARDFGAKRTVATIRRLEFLQLVERVGVDVVLNPQTSSAGVIQRFIEGNSSLLALHFLEGENLYALEYMISSQSRLAGKKLHQVRFPRGSLVGGLLRADGSVVLPKGSDVLLPGDRAVVLALPQVRAAVDKLFRTSV